MLRAIYWKPLSFNRMNKPKPPSPFFIHIIVLYCSILFVTGVFVAFQVYSSIFFIFSLFISIFFFLMVFFSLFVVFFLFVGSFFFLFHHLFHLPMKFSDYYDRRSMKRKWLIFQYSLQMNHSYYFGSFQYEIINNEYNVFEKKKK